MSLLSPLPASACPTDDLENQQPNNNCNSNKRPCKPPRFLPPPLLPLSVINGENTNVGGQSPQTGGILKPFDNDIFKSPAPTRSLKVTFQTPARTPKAVKSFSPSAWSALRELDDHERWVERTSVVTKQDHDDYAILAREFLDEIVDAAVCNQTEPGVPLLKPLQLEEILAPVTPTPTEKLSQDFLFDIETPLQDTQQQQAAPPVYDPFSPPREVIHKPEQPVVENTEAEQEVKAVPDSGDTVPLVGTPVKEEPVKELEPTAERAVTPTNPLTPADPVSDPIIMEEVSNKNIYELTDEDLQKDPFQSSTNQMQNSPPLPRAKSSGYNLNFDDMADPFGTGKQLGNSPPKSTGPPKMANSPPQTKKSPPKKQSPSPTKSNFSPDSSSTTSTTTPNGDMNTTPSPDTEAETVVVETVVVAPAVEPPTQLKTESATEVERSSSPVMVDSGGNSSPAAEDYVDALQVQQVPTEVLTLTTKEDGLQFSPSDLQQTEFSPSDELFAGIDQEEFNPSTEVFSSADPSQFDIDFLDKAGDNCNFKESALARQSLYVKFDPLVNAAAPSGGPMNGLPPHLQHITEGSENDLLQMQTPPPKGVGQRTANGGMKAPLPSSSVATAGKGQEDKLLAFTPPAPSAFSPPSKEEQLQTSPRDESDAGGSIPMSIPSPGSGNSQEDIVQVLRYSQADLQNAVKAAREAEKKAAKSEKEQFEEERAELMKQMSDKDQTIENMKTSNEDLRALVTDYERAMQEMMSDMSKVKNSQNSKFEDVQKEKDQAIEDMASVEVAFSDLHRRYEKLKQVVESLKKNEQILKDCVVDYKTKLTKQEQKYQTLKSHAEEKIEKANNEIDKVKSSYEAEIAGLQAAVKREQMMVASNERQIEQKTRDNAELTKICDELIAKMGGSRS